MNLPSKTMRVWRGLPSAASRMPCAITIGNFDGVHRGHQALLAATRQAADQRDIDSAVMTSSRIRANILQVLDATGTALRPALPGCATSSTRSA